MKKIIDKEIIEQVARNAWEKHVEGSTRYEDLKPEGKTRFVAAIKYAMNQALKKWINLKDC